MTQQEQILTKHFEVSGTFDNLTTWDKELLTNAMNEYAKIKQRHAAEKAWDAAIAYAPFSSDAPKKELYINSLYPTT